MNAPAKFDDGPIAHPAREAATITPRDLRFGRDPSHVQARWWLNGDPYATALYNALSVTFPKGEAFFIESVKAHRDGASTQLAEEIKAFTAQEVMHSREHLAFNRRVVDAGYDTTKLDKAVDDILELVRKRRPIINLAATMALEHFTAILARELLLHPEHLDGADKESADMWRWHALEEIEHKAVAYDTWLHATKDWSRLRRWWVKSLMMLIVTRRFIPERLSGAAELLRQDGISGVRVKAKLLWFAFGNPGMFRKIAGAWSGYFMPGFHPWNEDESQLISDADAVRRSN